MHDEAVALNPKFPEGYRKSRKYVSVSGENIDASFTKDGALDKNDTTPTTYLTKSLLSAFDN